jgi:hypothetical protein
MTIIHIVLFQLRSSLSHAEKKEVCRRELVLRERRDVDNNEVVLR